MVSRCEMQKNLFLFLLSFSWGKISNKTFNPSTGFEKSFVKPKNLLKLSPCQFALFGVGQLRFG